jgi:hypothetical protein
VSVSQLPEAISYIDHQVEHHRTRTFQEEYLVRPFFEIWPSPEGRKQNRPRLQPCERSILARRNASIASYSAIPSWS